MFTRNDGPLVLTTLIRILLPYEGREIDPGLLGHLVSRRGSCLATSKGCGIWI